MSLLATVAPWLVLGAAELPVLVLVATKIPASRMAAGDLSAALVLTAEVVVRSVTWVDKGKPAQKTRGWTVGMVARSPSVSHQTTSALYTNCGPRRPLMSVNIDDVGAALLFIIMPSARKICLVWAVRAAHR